MGSVSGTRSGTTGGRREEGEPFAAAPPPAEILHRRIRAARAPAPPAPPDRRGSGRLSRPLGERAPQHGDRFGLLAAREVRVSDHLQLLLRRVLSRAPSDDPARGDLGHHGAELRVLAQAGEGGIGVDRLEQRVAALGRRPQRRDHSLDVADLRGAPRAQEVRRDPFRIVRGGVGHQTRRRPPDRRPLDAAHGEEHAQGRDQQGRDHAGGLPPRAREASPLRRAPRRALRRSAREA